jgi:hypothetical protein
MEGGGVFVTPEPCTHPGVFYKYFSPRPRRFNWTRVTVTAPAKVLNAVAESPLVAHTSYLAAAVLDPALLLAAASAAFVHVAAGDRAELQALAASAARAGLLARPCVGIFMYILGCIVSNYCVTLPKKARVAAL